MLVSLQHAGLAALTVYMGRKKYDKEGKMLPEDSGKYPSLYTQAINSIVNDDDAFPATLEWVGQLREQVAADGGGGGGKKKK